MAKLNITAEQIQSTTNMILSGDTVTTWSDDKYPSAKAALDTAHPIGSIVVTSTNTSPATTIGGTREWLGGTWTLIDKEYRNELSTNFSESYWKIAMTGNFETGEGIGPVGATAGGWIARADHTLCLKLYLTTTVAINGSTLTSTGHKLGELVLSSIGVTGEIPLTLHNNMAYAVDSANNTYIVGYQLDGNGGITIKNIHDKKTLPAGSEIQLHLVLTMANNPALGSRMLDSFCDKFYWKRTA